MKQDNFKMSYTPEQKDEFQKIKEKYTSGKKEQTDLERLQALDKKVESPGQIVSLIIGIIGLLIAGGGMSHVLVNNAFLVGIPLSLLGIAVMLPAYPVYKAITKSRREKYAPQILEIIEKNDSISK